MTNKEAMDILKSTYVTINGGDIAHLNYSKAIEKAIESLVYMDYSIKILTEEYLTINKLIDEYGEAEFNAGNYQFDRNMLHAKELHKELIEKIDAVIFAPLGTTKLLQNMQQHK